MQNGRTDLALEAAEAVLSQHGPGVEVQEETLFGFPLTSVHVVDEIGARSVGKPVGRYLTLDLKDYHNTGMDAFTRAVDAVGRCLSRLLPDPLGETLVVGLGNRAVTPDAVGPRCADHVLVTRHLTRQDPNLFGGFLPVAALAAGVLGTTGVESAALVSAVNRELHPKVIVAVDALAARSVHRLCTTIQITDTGIIPGSGVGNAREALNADTLGVPVIALGVPTVVDGETVCQELGGRSEEDLSHTLVTPKDVDAQVSELGRILGYGINAALQREQQLTVEEMDYYLS